MGDVGQDTQFQKAILEPSSRILPLSDTLILGEHILPWSSLLPCCSHPHCRPSPALLEEAEGRGNALEPRSHKLIKIHLLPLTPTALLWASAWQHLLSQICTLYMFLV